MTDYMVAEEVKDFVEELFDKDGRYRMEGWKNLTPIEFGLLSWHLDNFYCSPLYFAGLQPCEAENHARTV